MRSKPSSPPGGRRSIARREGETPEAQQDRLDIWDYIAADNPQAAVQMDERLSQAASRLLDHPRIGRKGMIPGTFELIPHEHYRLTYEIDGDIAWILALAQTSRQWPPVRT